MKKFTFYIAMLLTILIFLPQNAISGRFSIKGITYKWININPFSGTRVYIDETQDSSIKYEPLDSVEITLVCGTDLYNIDSTNSRIVARPVFSDKNGNFYFKNLDIGKEKQMAIRIRKKGFIGISKLLKIMPDKKEYDLKVFMVWLVNYKR